MSRKSLTVECQRCGNEQTVERAGRYRDEDYYDLWADYMRLEAQHRQDVAQLSHKLSQARERIAELQALLPLLEPAMPTLRSKFDEPELETADPFA